MLAKITSGNQLTQPSPAHEALGNPSHLEVEADGARLILSPPDRPTPDDIRRKLEALGITEADVADAVAWARAQG